MSPAQKRRPPTGGGKGGGGAGFGGGAPNMAQLMQQAQRMQRQVEQAQAELALAEVVGTAGGGMVSATMSGAGELRSLVIAPAAVDPDDIETLQDLVVAAVRDAARAAGELSEQTLAPISGGAGGLGLPGL